MVDMQRFRGLDNTMTRRYLIYPWYSMFTLLNSVVLLVLTSSCVLVCDLVGVGSGPWAGHCECCLASSGVWGCCSLCLCWWDTVFVGGGCWRSVTFYPFSGFVYHVLYLQLSRTFVAHIFVLLLIFLLLEY